VRPIDSHGGKGLVKVDGLEALSAYLSEAFDDEFYISRFIDYSSPDGQFRKYRITFIDGVFFPSHLAISSHWMIHYFNAGMTESADKRREEEAFFAQFDTGFGKRHLKAFNAINASIGLDFLSIDCAETSSGDLLVFEVDNAAIVHALDDPEMFPYKPPAMQKLFDAFRGLLESKARGGVSVD
jgi:hypothetical protein